jgi:hypothetical protein
MAKLTVEALRAKAAEYTAKADALEAAEKAGNTLANLASGGVIEFMFGRGETRKQRAGVVLGIAETDKGKRIKIQTGEGFDAEILVISPDAIVAVAEDIAEGQAMDPTAASADPLASLS